MSALDRAFIKAYAEMPPGSCSKPAVDNSDLANGSMGPHAMPPRPRVPFSASPARTLEPVYAPPPLAASQGTMPKPKAPLSAYAPATKSDDALHAHVEVDEIAWPQECHDLIDQARRGFDHFADHLTERLTHDERSIAIVGCTPGDGRTLITLAVARHLATRGIHAAMVDANFANPMLAPSCRITPQCGWTEVVAGQRTLEEALITSRAEGVTLVPCRGRSQSAAPPTDAVRLAATFDTLKEQYDLVLLDTGALGTPETLRSFADLARAIRLDAVYLVRDARCTTVEELTGICSALQQARVVVAGIIDNFVAPAEMHHSRLSIPLTNFASRLLALRG
ncbi:MAG: hypothetical protein WD845_00110 [Pirellulales bacterium]